MIQFRNTKFWQNYSEYDKIVDQSSMRSTVDAVIYWRLLNAYKFKNFLEIGIYQGLTTGLFFESSPNASVTGIDPVGRLELFYKNYPEHQDRFTFVNQPSQAVTLTDTYDFILVDGDHDYDPAISDITKCLPHLDTNGILALDDYKSIGVAKAIKDLYNLTTDWVPFLRAEQTEFWHHRSNDQGKFLDSLLTDPISKFIFIQNEFDSYNNCICTAKTLGIFTDQTEYFDLALKHYNI